MAQKQTIQTEPIYAALFALAQTANTTDTPFVRMSRRLIPFKGFPDADVPALFQEQTSQLVQEPKQGLARNLLGAFWWVYLPKSTTLSDVCSATMNQYRDALINILYPIAPGFTPGQAQPLAGYRQTLGGLVTHCWVEGEIVMVEGLLDFPSLVRIPIKILAGM